MIKVILLFLFTLASFTLRAQDKASLKFDGNIRYSLNGSGQENGFENGQSAIRFRAGAVYIINQHNSLRGRLAMTISDEFEPIRFTIKADGSGLALGSSSFDEFYYRYKKQDWDIKIGRFQHSISVLSNARRSLMRFQSNNVTIHWSDGIYAKKNLTTGWYGELIAEYQPRNHTTFPYQGNLNFGNSSNNFTTYLAVENRERDSKNIIQKGIGVFFSPNTYQKNGSYTSYLAFTSRIAFDIPKKDVLKGGSIRVAAELGQNLNTSINKGTIAVASIGLNKVANKHEIMLEFAKTDQQWLLANVYGRNGDEVELRYRFFVTKTLNIDARYRIRNPRTAGSPNIYTTFLRTTYSF